MLTLGVDVFGLVALVVVFGVVVFPFNASFLVYAYPLTAKFVEFTFAKTSHK